MATSSRIILPILQLLGYNINHTEFTNHSANQNPGIINTFGVYQTYYATDLLSNRSASDISWIGSLQSSLLMIIGSITGPLYDRGYFRSLIFAGSFLVIFGMMMTSICTEYWQILLAQGVVVGLGCGCLFIPSVAIVATYFSTRKAFAIGFATAGSSIAGIIYPIVFDRLQRQIGFPWATRVLAFMMLATLVAPVTFMRLRVVPMEKRALIDSSAFKELPFMLFTAGCFFIFMGLYVPFYYIPEFGVFVKALTPEFSLYTIAIINAASTFGRIIPNYLADKVGGLNLMLPCALASSVVAFCWIPAKNEAGLIVICVLYGFFSGTFVSLPGTVIIGFSPTLSVVGTRMGMVFTMTGIALLIGSPIAGAILGSNERFVGLQSYCAACILVGAIFLYLTRVASVGTKFFKIA